MAAVKCWNLLKRLLNRHCVGQRVSARSEWRRGSHHLPQSVRAHGGWPWRWEGRGPARRRPWPGRTCWWWSASGWPCSEDCFGGLGGWRKKRGKRWEACLCIWERMCYFASRNLIPNPAKSIEYISRYVTQDQLGWTVCWITYPNLCGAAFQTLPSPTHGLIAPDGVIDWLFWLPFTSAWTPISKAGYAE